MTVADSDDPPGSTVSDPEQTHYSTEEAGTELPSIALVKAVAAAKDVDPMTLPPIGSDVDMDALDAILQSSPGERPVVVTVGFQDVRAEIDSQGTVTVRREDTDASNPDT